MHVARVGDRQRMAWRVGKLTQKVTSRPSGWIGVAFPPPRSMWAYMRVSGHDG